MKDFDRGVPMPPFDTSGVRAAELRGAQAFHWGWPRASLETIPPEGVPKAIHEARLRGYDRAAAAVLMDYEEPEWWS
jgi:hypothetical protein